MGRVVREELRSARRPAADEAERGRRPRSAERHRVAAAKSPIEGRRGGLHDGPIAERNAQQVSVLRDDGGTVREGPAIRDRRAQGRRDRAGARLRGASRFGAHFAAGRERADLERGGHEVAARRPRRGGGRLRSGRVEGGVAEDERFGGRPPAELDPAVSFCVAAHGRHRLDPERDRELLPRMTRVARRHDAMHLRERQRAPAVEREVRADARVGGPGPEVQLGARPRIDGEVCAALRAHIQPVKPRNQVLDLARRMKQPSRAREPVLGAEDGVVLQEQEPATETRGKGEH
jgi:hypothetical protein